MYQTSPAFTKQKDISKELLPRWLTPNCISYPSTVVANGHMATPALLIRKWRVFSSGSQKLPDYFMKNVCSILEFTCVHATYCCRYSQRTGRWIWCRPGPDAWPRPLPPSPPSWCPEPPAPPSPCLCTPKSPAHLQRWTPSIRSIRKLGLFISFNLDLGATSCLIILHDILQTENLNCTAKILQTAYKSSWYSFYFVYLPLPARSLAVSLPIPTLAPVTIAVFPSRRTSEDHWGMKWDLRREEMK